MAVSGFLICIQTLRRRAKNVTGKARTTKFDNEKAGLRRFERRFRRKKGKRDPGRKERKVDGYHWEVRIIYYWLIVAPTSGFLSFDLNPVMISRRSSSEPFNLSLCP